MARFLPLLHWIAGSIDATPSERVLEFVAKWGRNASPFFLASAYVRLHWKGVSHWRDVAKAARAGRALLKKVDDLEKGARAFGNATDQQYAADLKLPGYPLQTDDKAGHVWATPEEMEYVEKYFNTAKMIANDAAAARVELEKAIAGWDAAVREANAAKDFTRQSAWEAINDLDDRFNNSGGSFRAYLVAAPARAVLVENSASMKQIHAAHILGKPTPDWYQPPGAP